MSVHILKYVRRQLEFLCVLNFMLSKPLYSEFIAEEGEHPI